jgi:hypothetical protein
MARLISNVTPTFRTVYLRMLLLPVLHGGAARNTSSSLSESGHFFKWALHWTSKGFKIRNFLNTTILV